MGNEIESRRGSHAEVTSQSFIRKGVKYMTIDKADRSERAMNGTLVARFKRGQGEVLGEINPYDSSFNDILEAKINANPGDTFHNGHPHFNAQVL